MDESRRTASDAWGTGLRRRPGGISSSTPAGYDNHWRRVFPADLQRHRPYDAPIGNELLVQDRAGRYRHSVHRLHDDNSYIYHVIGV